VREESYLRSDANPGKHFMSVFDVHVNRAPVEGRIDFVDYRTGGFCRGLYREDASSGNETALTGVPKRLQQWWGENR